MQRRKKSVSITTVSLAWATGVCNGKQPDSTAYERKEAAILQPDMQNAFYMSQKVRNVLLSEHIVADRNLK